MDWGSIILAGLASGYITTKTKSIVHGIGGGFCLSLVYDLLRLLWT